jgi:hypothetical protein
MKAAAVAARGTFLEGKHHEQQQQLLSNVLKAAPVPLPVTHAMPHMKISILPLLHRPELLG